MTIRLHETAIASRDINALKDFYSKIMSDDTKVDHNDFFYTIKNSNKQISIVPHNGEKKWDKPWLIFTSDDLLNDIEKIKSLGIDETTISPLFEALDENNKPSHGITFNDPDGHLIMLMKE